MAARVTHLVAEMIVPSIAYSPTTPTGAGVTQMVMELIVAPNSGSGQARVSQVVVEMIVAGAADQQHGATTTPPETSAVFG